MPVPSNPEEGVDWELRSAEVFTPLTMYYLLSSETPAGNGRIRAALEQAGGDPVLEREYLGFEMGRLLDMKAQTIEAVKPEEISIWKPSETKASRLRRFGYWLSNTFDDVLANPKVSDAAGYTLTAAGLVGMALIFDRNNSDQLPTDLPGVGLLLASVVLFASGLCQIGKSNTNST